MRTPILKAKGVFGDDLEIAEGEFVAVLSLDCESRRNLLSVLSFESAPEKGEVYFQGRLVGRGGAQEKAAMQERVKLVPECALEGLLGLITDEGLVKVVLIDGRKSPWHVRESARTLDLIKSLNSKGIGVLLATGDASSSLAANTIYKIGGGIVRNLASAL